jgi:cytohesin
MKHLLLTTIAAVLVVGCGPQPPDISIHKAAGEGNIEAVKQHLAAGVDANAKEGEWGYTPLHEAVYEGHKEVAELLIANGADVNAIIMSGEWKGDTPLDLAFKTEIADLLRKHGGKTGDWLNADKSIHIATRAGHIEAVKQHLAAGTDVNAKRYEQTPLHFASDRGTKEVAELLIARGADVNAADKSGWTPLHAAVMGGEETVELLIANGANVNAKVASGSYKGMTPLDLASKAVIVDLIRKHGGESGK